MHSRRGRATALAIAAFAVAAHAYTTQNVIVLDITGVRYSESFGDADPSHPHIDRIWNELRPQGTLYLDSECAYGAWTTASTYHLLTGSWQLQPDSRNNWPYFEHRPYFADFGVHPTAPTIGEYVRAALNLPADKVWIIGGKENVNSAEFSVHPLYGQTYAASIDASERTDLEVFDRVAEVLSTYQPVLVHVELGDTDRAHRDGIEAYKQALAAADQIAWRIWDELIVRDPQSHYTPDNTTFFVLHGHGRHDEAHGGFVDGGKAYDSGWCPGCRHTSILVIGGADIVHDQTVSTPVANTSIAATIGELLGVPTPFASARVLTEALASGPPTPQHVNQAQPALVVDRDRVHLVYTESAPGNDESRQLYYRRRSDRKGSWEAPVRLSDPARCLRASRPSIQVTPHGLEALWHENRAIDGEVNWTILRRISTDEGAHWGPEEVVGTSRIETVQAPLGQRLYWDAQLAGAIDGDVICGVAVPGILGILQEQEGGSWTPRIVDDSQFWPRRPRIVAVESGVTGRVGMVYQSLVEKQTGVYRWGVWFKRSDNRGRTWNRTKRLSGLDGISHWPAIAWNGGGRLIVIWNEWNETTGVSQILSRYSSNQGADWSRTTERVSEASLGVGRPALTYDPKKGEFIAVWPSGTADAGMQLFYATTRRGTSWSAPQRLEPSAAGAHQRRPAISAEDDGTVWVAWEERNPDAGGWRVMDRKLR